MTGFTAHMPTQLSRHVPTETQLQRYVLPAGILLASVAAASLARRRARTNGRTVGDVMVDEVLTVEADEPLWKAAQLMRDANIGVLPVVEHGLLRGIVTDRDLVIRGLAEGADPSSMKAGDCATWDIVCARAESSVEEVIEVMSECKVGRLPVVDADNRVIGIVTLSSLALRSRKKEDAFSAAQEVSKRSARSAA